MKERETLQYPQKQGLYDPQYEHDACGVGFIAHLKGRATHEMVKQGIDMLTKLNHRGGENDGTGDGAGILMQIPHLFFNVNAHLYQKWGTMVLA